MTVTVKEVGKGATAAAQVNVRMDRALKEAGDTSLAEVGLSPSDAVRALWEVMAQRGETREQLLSSLGVINARDDRQEKRERRRELVNRIAARYEGLGKGGIDPASLPALEEDDWEELVWSDLQARRGGGGAQ